ncbi:MAG: hypothetical protein DRR19_05255 [Candidatus Parabeggiatoa sp. nov. 1]|nr:MAG: hypothetical protein DRR19_05255 [Gammaproteobacteria bacterium]
MGNVFLLPTTNDWWGLVVVVGWTTKRPIIFHLGFKLHVLVVGARLCRENQILCWSRYGLLEQF